MGKNTLIEMLKEFIGKVCFNIFLWSIDSTKEQYWEEIARQEIDVE